MSPPVTSTMTFDDKLSSYADLIVAVGLNLQAGQQLMASAPLEASPLLAKVTEAAYKRGVRYVHPFYSDDAVTLARFKHAPRDSFSFYPDWLARGMLEAGTVTVPLAQGKTSVAAQQSSTCEGAVFAQSPNLERDGGYELCGEIPTGSPPQFDLKLTYRNDRGYFETNTYSMTRQPSELADPNLLVRGKLVYAQGEPFTHSEPFEFTEDSHAIVQLWWWTGPTVADVPGELITSTTLEDISSFPIEYRLEGDAEEIFARRGEYYLNVGVFSGDGGVSGEKFAVGDLSNETYTLVPNPGAEVEVKMTSFEACDSPAAGGRCL